MLSVSMVSLYLTRVIKDISHSHDILFHLRVLIHNIRKLKILLSPSNHLLIVNKQTITIMNSGMCLRLKVQPNLVMTKFPTIWMHKSLNVSIGPQIAHVLTTIFGFTMGILGKEKPWSTTLMLILKEFDPPSPSTFTLRSSSSLRTLNPTLRAPRRIKVVNNLYKIYGMVFFR